MGCPIRIEIGSSCNFWEMSLLGSEVSSEVSVRIKLNSMHVQPWHLPRRTWPIRHVGRCHGTGGNFEVKGIFQGSGTQGKIFKDTFKTQDAREFFLTDSKKKKRRTVYFLQCLCPKVD